MKGFIFLPINPDTNSKELNYIESISNPIFIIDDLDIFEHLREEYKTKPQFDTLKSEISSIFFTSGTTGSPKGVCHSIDSLVENVLAFNDTAELADDLRFYHILPMSYMAGFLNSFLSPIMAGGLIILGPKFSPLNATRFWEIPKKWSVNTIWLTPTIVSFLTRMNRDKEIASWVEDNIKKAFCGTAPLNLKIRGNFENLFGVTLLESYGMSEVLLVAVQSSNKGSEKGSVGSLLKDIKIMSNFGSKKDELFIQTPYRYKKYLLDKEQDQENRQLMETGDLGELREGYLFITGRIKDIIIKGGINISPIYLENKISEVDGVQDISVVGLPHDFWGEVPYAFIVAEIDKSEEEIEKNILTFLKNTIDESIIPEKYIWLDEMPKSPNGKILKNKLIEGII